jgi:phosphoglucomutase
MSTSFDLSFGTGGLRGVLGGGPGRMNIQTVGRAAKGVADWLGQTGKAVVAYDTRHYSREFAEHTAAMLAANGIDVYLFPRPVPTPLLSFAVRAARSNAGICITASHNPAKYNGFKVYGADGGQITLTDAETIERFIHTGGKPYVGGHKPILQVPDDVIEDYLNAVYELRVTRTPCHDLRVVYTPLNGAGMECVSEIMRRMDADFITVPEQEKPDGDFPTCRTPNPEEGEALELGEKLCLEEKRDLLLATDPDCDRAGVSVYHHGVMRRLTGNETGVLLLEYLCRHNGKRVRPVAVKTIVTTPMAQAICDAHGVELRNVLTGFKYIGEQMGLLEQAGEAGRFLFGFEESCGYLSGRHARDKDGCNAVLLICDMAAEYKRRGMTLIDAIEWLYQRYGRWTTKLVSIGSKPCAVPEIHSIAGRPVLSKTDYRDGIGGLPKADVLAYSLEDGTIIVRPSGTEPKVKIYYMLRGLDVEEVSADFQRLYMGRNTP